MNRLEEMKSDLMILAESKLEENFEKSDCMVLLESAKTIDKLNEISELYNLE